MTSLRAVQYLGPPIAVKTSAHRFPEVHVYRVPCTFICEIWPHPLSPGSSREQQGAGGGGPRPVGRQKEAPLEMELGCVRPNLKTRRELLQRRAFWQTAGVSYICT